ncbi:hypothetical protein FTO70_14605 [Methanosarcina sp. KYL-1]|uniref:hypothetical protein n=1 Tax=Methanosarcina sp. KYL-1 TaxID=2602068 RepID=UPI002101A272|nr:hypothetical protein [Methanosarcina sp. KYL-1]MCQ1536879.1 hypothetical protein [Methanosarcina sp. KYL-1]
MTLPDICPLDSSKKCKGLDCHLFCLEWRTKEPICLIGYGATSRTTAGRTDRKKDTYAEETFNKLGRQPLPKRRTGSENGDWTPSRMAERPPEKPAERREETHLLRGTRRAWPEEPGRSSEGRLREGPEGKQRESLEGRLRESLEGKQRESLEGRFRESPGESLNGKGVSSEAEVASMRLESRLKKEPVEENPIIYAKPQPRAQEKPKVQEKVISRDKHTTIFASCDGNENSPCCPAGKEESPKKPAELREKRKKVDDFMELDLPDNYEEEFWS